MKINNVTIYSHNNNYKQKANISKQQSFKGYSHLLDEILKANDLTGPAREKALTKLGELYHKTFPHYSIYECNYLLSNYRREASEKGQKIITAAIEKVKMYRKGLVDRATSITEKINTDAQNLIESKNRISNLFISLIKTEQDISKTGNGVIPNGILIHGNSEKNNLELLEHAKKANINFKEIIFDQKAPLKSMYELFEEAEKTKANYNILNRRTLVHYKNIDELFAAERTRENKDLMNVLKQFTEQCSDNNKTTVITTTTKKLENLDAPSIGDHRFDLKVRYNKLTTEADELQLKADKAEIKRLDKMAEIGTYSEKAEEQAFDNWLKEWEQIGR